MMKTSYILTIDKICCDKMKEMLDKEKITYNKWNFFWHDETIFYCPFCGERCF